jgi:hypothetical protein
MLPAAVLNRPGQGAPWVSARYADRSAAVLALPCGSAATCTASVTQDPTAEGSNACSL